MRKPKKDTTEWIHLIEKTWSETQKGRTIKTKEQAEIVGAINGTLYFLELLDEVRGENHKTYFIKKYLSLHNNMSQARLSSEYCICRDSVSAYCAMYLKIFEINLIAMKELSIEEGAATKDILTGLSRATVQNRKSL